MDENKKNPVISGGLPINDDDFTSTDKMDLKKKSDIQASLSLVKNLKSKTSSKTNTGAVKFAEEIMPEGKPNNEYKSFFSDANDDDLFTKTENAPLNNTAVKQLSEQDYLSDDYNDSKSFSQENIIPAPKQTVSYNQLSENDYLSGNSTTLPDNAPKPVSSIKPLSEADYLQPQPEIDKSEPVYYTNNAENVTPAFSSSENISDLQTSGYLFDKQPEDNKPVYTVDNADDVFASLENTEPAYMVTTEETAVSGDLNEILPGSTKDKKSKDKNAKADYPKYSTEADIKSGRKFAWLAYILFFIPLMFNSKNQFVRHHANEGLEINIIDILGLGLMLFGYYYKTTIVWLEWVLIAALIIGVVLLILTTITKIFMIIASLLGKETQTPWLWKTRIIKPQ